MAPDRLKTSARSGVLSRYHNVSGILQRQSSLGVEWCLLVCLVFHQHKNRVYHVFKPPDVQYTKIALHISKCSSFARGWL